MPSTSSQLLLVNYYWCAFAKSDWPPKFRVSPIQFRFLRYLMLPHFCQTVKRQSLRTLPWCQQSVTLHMCQHASWVRLTTRSVGAFNNVIIAIGRWREVDMRDREIVMWRTSHSSDSTECCCCSNHCIESWIDTSVSTVAHLSKYSVRLVVTTSHTHTDTDTQLAWTSPSWHLHYIILNYSKTTRKHTVYRRYGFTLEAFIRTDFRCRSSVCKSLSHMWATYGTSFYILTLGD